MIHSKKIFVCTGMMICLLLLGKEKLFSQVPKGWHEAGSNPNDYDMVYDHDVKHQGKSSARINSRSDEIDGFGTFMQTFKADKYRGKRVKLKAWLKTEEANSGQMWMRIDCEAGMCGFDNMDNRPLTGNNDWNEYSIVLDIPEDAVFIAFGTFLAGTGSVWVDDYEFDIVNSEVPVTEMMQEEEKRKTEDPDNWKTYVNKEGPTEPSNLDCEG